MMHAEVIVTGSRTIKISLSYNHIWRMVCEYSICTVAMPEHNQFIEEKNLMTLIRNQSEVMRKIKTDNCAI
jgi:hypothetical protein